MDGVQKAAGHGHALVELPADPAEQRQHDEAGHQHAPEGAGKFPVQARAMRERASSMGYGYSGNCAAGTGTVPIFVSTKWDCSL